MPTWAEVLTYRPPEQQAEVVSRLEAQGLTPIDLQRALIDGGDALYAALQQENEIAFEPFGGVLAATLLAAEVGALSAHLTARAARIRAVTLQHLLNDYSAVTLAVHLGVARQKIYELAKPQQAAHFLSRVPWNATEDTPRRNP